MELNFRLKRINIIGKRRGSKELDLIFGRFIDNNLAELDDPLLHQFEEFLELNDSDLYDYFFGNVAPPRKFERIYKKILEVLV
ncbi:MAG: succinate dehydrogenase assembly factor 2 [Paracoccaceae bacterium]